MRWNSQEALDKYIKSSLQASANARSASCSALISVVGTKSGASRRRQAACLARQTLHGYDPNDRQLRGHVRLCRLHLRRCNPRQAAVKHPPPRTAKLALEHVNAIRTVAHKMGLGSIALATTIQFELDLRQKDVIGEWEPAPLAEGGIAYRGRRWVNGIVWGRELDPTTLILTKTHTKTGITVQYDLKEHPPIMEELALIPPECRVGPLIVSERTGQPYKHCRFTQNWRRVANAAGYRESCKIGTPGREPYRKVAMPVSPSRTT
jgi:hypothetical protein